MKGIILMIIDLCFPTTDCPHLNNQYKKKYPLSPGICEYAIYP
ncbi:MAG: hypothetical protein JG781_970 [Peptococcaceae bacterium]|nr:hypothetical protein [Peptococcaceae bacterium]